MSTKDELAQIFPNGNICVCKYDAIQLFDVPTLVVWVQGDKNLLHWRGESNAPEAGNWACIL